ncbi:MAG: hypothetical protein E7384_03815 [Ruminococcaceae bacterium]|nr:hypothetical protein [Oscillospiraceae bacterium]
MKKMQQLKISKLKNLVGRRYGMLALVLSFVMLLTTISFAWYQNQVSLEGNTFSTGDIDFVSRGYDSEGNLVTTILQGDKDPAGYEKVNQPLFNHIGWDANMQTETSYIVVEKTGSLEMDYKISFTAAGTVEYLGGFWYALTDVTNEVVGTSSNSDHSALLKDYIAKGNNPKAETDGYNMATMDRYATIGSILDGSNITARYYRLDYGMKSSAIPEEYTNMSVEIFAKIFVTQVGALDSEDGTGYTYNCSSQLDIEKAREQALPGDNIVLLNNITFEGDLVFNKGVNLFTNNYTLEVLGNLIYEYVAPTAMTVNVSGNGRILVSCPRAGVGGNFTIEAPNSDVTIIGSNTSDGDIVTESRFTVSGTRAYGAAGVTLRNLRVVDKAYGTLKTIYVNSNSRVTVTDNTTISRLEAVARATNIEVQNMGIIHELSLINMYILPQTLSPQIYVYNMGIITQSIQLPAWSTPFEIVTQSPLTCSGNTKIVQAITGNDMSVTGATVTGAFTTADIERENIDDTVVPMGNSNTQLIVYYQNIKKDGQTVETTIQSLLEDYFREINVVNVAAAIAEITDLRVISVEGKQVLNSDIQYLRGAALPYLKNIDLERAILFDTVTSRENHLFDNAFNGDTRIENLVLPQRLESIGVGALSNMSCDNVIRIPESVKEFGVNWFRGTKYVCFESPTPVIAAYNAASGLSGVKAIFTEEPYLSAYRQNYANYANIIYCVGQKDDSGNNFVRRLNQGNDWEIVYYIGNQGNITSLSVGSNVRVDGQLINIVNIGENAYGNTLPDSVTTISFADGVRVIGKRAFYGRPIKSVESWGISLTTIGYGAFENCSLLQGEIMLPATMQTIDSYAFASCGMLEGINAGGTKFVYTGAFLNCSGMVYADMSSVETFETVGTVGVFNNCPRLVSVTAPTLKKTIGNVFWNLSSLREVVFGAASFEEVAVSGFTSFYGSVGNNTKIYFDVDDTSLVAINGVSSERIYSAGNKLGEVIVNDYNIGEYIIRNNDNGEVVLVTSNIDYVSNGSSADLISFPEEYNGSIVTEIGRNAFRYQTFDNVKISFGSGLKKIGEYAFYEKSGIEYLDFSQAVNLKNIGEYAFCRNVGIEGDLILPQSMHEIGAYAFYSCSEISNINTGGTSFVRESAFELCGKIVKAELPEVLILGGATNDNSAVFLNCSSLVAVYMPKLYLINGFYTFRYCTALRELHMASSNAEMNFNGYSFTDCDSSKIKIFVPEELVDFYRAKGLAGLQDRSVFEEGEKLGENIIFGYNIGEYIVKENHDGTATLITSRIDFSSEVVLPSVWNDNGVERKITVIGESAFKNGIFNNATLSIGEYVELIETNAFDSANGLKAVNSWGNALTTIANNAFFNCADLTADIVLPDSLDYIGDSAFASSGIKSVVTGGATAVGWDVFKNCQKLIWAELSNVVMIGKAGRDNCLFEGSENLVSVRAPLLSVVKGQFIFIGCGSLRELYLGASDFESLGGYAFYLCQTDKIKIFVPAELLDFYKSKNPDGLGATHIYPIGEKVGTNELNGYNLGRYIVKVNEDGQTATLITSNVSFEGDVTLPNTFTSDGKEFPITAIFKNAFMNESFTNVNLTVGAHVKEISENAFYGRKGILNVNLKNTETVCDSAFYNCSDMTNLVANYLKTIKGNNAFNGCLSLTILTLPSLENVTGSQNFANNTSIKKVYLQNIVSLGNQTFYGCSNLEEFVVNKKLSSANDIPTATDAFSGDVRTDLPIRVPAASMSYYGGSWQGRPVLAYGDTIVVGDESFVVLPMNGGYIIQSYIGGSESVVIPETLGTLNVVGLEENAFGIVTQTITSVTLPKYLYFLGFDALSELLGLNEIAVDSENRFFSSVDGVLYSKDKKMLVRYPHGKTDASFTVPDMVVAISGNAFKNARNLNSIILGSGLGAIDSVAFIGCNYLGQITFTGAVPPVLMGASIFDTNLTGFTMTVPTGSVDAYIRAMNFAEYAPYMNGGIEIPTSGDMNMIHWGPAVAQQTNVYPTSSRKKDEEDYVVNRTTTSGN